MVNVFPDLLDVAVKGSVLLYPMRVHQVLILWVLILFKTSFSLFVFFFYLKNQTKHEITTIEFLHVFDLKILAFYIAFKM